MSIVPVLFEKNEIGGLVKKSKVQYTWKLQADGQMITVDLISSRMSGKKRVYKDGALVTRQQTMEGNFSYTFPVQNNMFTIYQLAHDNYDLRINAESFSHLYSKMKTQHSFNYQDPRDRPPTEIKYATKNQNVSSEYVPSGHGKPSYNNSQSQFQGGNTGPGSLSMGNSQLQKQVSSSKNQTQAFVKALQKAPFMFIGAGQVQRNPDRLQKQLDGTNTRTQGYDNFPPQGGLSSMSQGQQNQYDYYGSVDQVNDDQRQVYKKSLNELMGNQQDSNVTTKKAEFQTSKEPEFDFDFNPANQPQQFDFKSGPPTQTTEANLIEVNNQSTNNSAAQANSTNIMDLLDSGSQQQQTSQNFQQEQKLQELISMNLSSSDSNQPQASAEQRQNLIADAFSGINVNSNQQTTQNAFPQFNTQAPTMEVKISSQQPTDQNAAQQNAKDPQIASLVNFTSMNQQQQLLANNSQLDQIGNLTSAPSTTQQPQQQQQQQQQQNVSNATNQNANQQTQGDFQFDF